MTAVEPLSEAEVAELLWTHGGHSRCLNRNPKCRIAATIRARDAEIARLRDQLAGQCAYCWLERWFPGTAEQITRIVCERHRDIRDYVTSIEPEPAP